jgi:hypothetical protein
MKKFIIIIAACLFAFGNVYADNWTSVPNDPVGNFTLGVYCDPSLTGGTSHNLGTFFTEQTGLTISSSLYTLSWFLTGPTADVASYTLIGSGQATALADNSQTTVSITSTGGTGGESELHGYWDIPLLETGSSVNCVAGNHDCEIRFVPLSIDSHGTGTQTFDISLSITVGV